jgi:hypothetical protein
MSDAHQEREAAFNDLMVRLRDYARDHDLSAPQIEALLNASSACCVLGERAPELTAKLRRAV